MGWHWRSKPWLSCTGAPAPAVVNPEDIELGDGVDEEEDAGGDDGDVKLQQKAVPVRHLPCMPPYVGLTSACRCLADDLLTPRPLPEACTHQAAAIARPLTCYIACGAGCGVQGSRCGGGLSAKWCTGALQEETD